MAIHSHKEYKLRDVFRLVHPTTPHKEQWNTWMKLLNNELEAPDTWEVNLSGGADKKETFTRLINEKKLGALALLRNLRNMQQAGVEDRLIRKALVEANAEKVLPFRFISAAKYGPQFEGELEQLMFRNLVAVPRLPGKTILLIDGSGSMDATVSTKSDINRFDAAAGVAMLLREICQGVSIYKFSYQPELIPSRRGFALRDALGKANGGTNTGFAVAKANQEGYDRLIIITDEQSHQSIAAPIPGSKGYVINVASFQNGIGYGPYTHVDGWSESVVSYISEFEKGDF